ncbi:MAG: DNA internalization-related competence protein ComEC/Rec2 [Mycoplasmatales bacterium]
MIEKIKYYIKEILFSISFSFLILHINNLSSFIIVVVTILIIMYNNLKYFNRKKRFYYYFIFSFFSYLIIYNFMFYLPLSIQSEEKIQIEVKQNLQVEDTYLTFITKVKHKKVKIFYYIGENEENNNLHIEYGNIYEVRIDEINQIDNLYKNHTSFNYKKYEKSKKINFSLQVSEAKLIDNNYNIVNLIKNFRKNLIEKVKNTYPKQADYINSLLLGEKITDEKLQENIQNIGIIQLFTISGMHIIFLILGLEFILSLLKVTKKNIRITILFILPIYSILAGFGVSIQRVLEVYYLQSYYYFKNQQVDSLLILLLVLSLNVLFNPYNLINVGFILSYSISIFLILNQEVWQYQAEFFVTKIKQNLQIILFVLPLTNSLTNTFNILLPLTLVIYTKIVQMMIILSCLLLLLLIIPIKIILLPILCFYNLCISIFKLLNYLNVAMIINLKSFSFMIIIIYYYSYIKQLEEYYYYKGKRLKQFYQLFLLILLINLPLNLIGKVQIIDVGQGDSILIQYPLANKNILIDTGPQEAEEELIDYLRAKGLKKIDYLILTHNHADHVGNTRKILEEIKVKNIIVGSNFNNLQEIKNQNKELLSKINLIEIKGLQQTKIGYFYASPQKYEEENNNSIVYYTKLGKVDYLFMGDAEKEVEQELIKQYDLDFIDRIKVGHHGSKTSTSNEFLQATTPEEVFICSGKDNMYGHPAQETIDKLENNKIKYENTQTDGEIVKYFF